jgi:hypothetical protein
MNGSPLCLTIPPTSLPTHSPVVLSNREMVREAPMKVLKRILKGSEMVDWMMKAAHRTSQGKARRRMTTRMKETKGAPNLGSHVHRPVQTAL